MDILMMIWRFFLSESGYPGLKDFQDFHLDILMMIERFYLSESGYPGFEDFQDFYLDVVQDDLDIVII
ncbi:hypothetical protein [Sphaerospermopsis torques-reginae]|uniref:hypothetical protein n=1 Tax=Sphaerospermopsis torques-reginae TaxID=984207 RepID=UPI001FE5EDFD|nr:hypothetical protein [Sphaerospermopsis torques-reginae]